MENILKEKITLVQNSKDLGEYKKVHSFRYQNILAKYENLSRGCRIPILSAYVVLF
jgi:hypothetical protein